MTTNSFRKSAATLVVLSSMAMATAGAIAQTPAAPDAKPATPQAVPAAPDARSAAPDAAPAAPEKKAAPARARRAPAEPKAPPQAPEDSPLAPLAWLEGCWRGTVNQREYREHWMPLRGNLMLGMSQTVVAGKTQDFEYLRLEVAFGRRSTTWRFRRARTRPRSSSPRADGRHDRRSKRRCLSLSPIRRWNFRKN